MSLKLMAAELCQVRLSNALRRCFPHPLYPGDVHLGLISGESVGGMGGETTRPGKELLLNRLSLLFC